MSPAIVRVLTRLGAGGPPIHSVLLTREMTERGYPSVLVTGRCAGGDGDMSYLLRPGDAVHFIEEMSRAVSPWQDLVALVKLWRFLRRQRPLIVHTHTAKAGVLGRVAARLAGVPVVVHTFHGNVLSGYFSRTVNVAIRLAERVLARFTDAICALSPQQATEMAERYHVAPRAKIHVVPLGMDLEPFRRLAPAPRDGRLVVGWLGRLVAIKNVPLLAEVVRETVRCDDRVRFVIAGDGPERAAVERLAAELGPERCAYLGWQRDVAPVIAQCHVLVQTSRNEGTPVALIQGMAAGRPFVSTAAGGVVDMVTGGLLREAAGSRWFANGVLAEPDPGAFASVLRALAADAGVLEAMGRAAMRFAAQAFTKRALVDRLEALYAELLAQKQAASLVRLAECVGFRAKDIEKCTH